MKIRPAGQPKNYSYAMFAKNFESLRELHKELLQIPIDLSFAHYEVQRLQDFYDPGLIVWRAVVVSKFGCPEKNWNLDPTFGIQRYMAIGTENAKRGLDNGWEQIKKDDPLFEAIEGRMKATPTEIEV